MTQKYKKMVKIIQSYS